MQYGRLPQSHPDHGLDHHRHGAHTGNRGGGGLDEVGAVLALGTVAIGHGRAENACQHLPADEESEREIHVRGGDAAERAQNQDADRSEQQVVFPAVDRGQPAPATRIGNGGRSNDNWIYRRHRCRVGLVAQQRRAPGHTAAERLEQQHIAALDAAVAHADIAAPAGPRRSRCCRVPVP